MTAEISHHVLARVLSQDNIQVYYSFFGSPCVAASGPRGALDANLNDIAGTVFRVYVRQNAVESQHANTAMDYVTVKFLLVKIHNLYELADRQIAVTNIITRLFIAIRAFLESCFCCCYHNDLPHAYDLAGESLACIPLEVARSEALLAHLIPVIRNSQTKEKKVSTLLKIW